VTANHPRFDPAATTRIWSLRQNMSDRPSANPPVHGVVAGPDGRDLGYANQSWCGKQPQFRHHVRPGTRAEVTCKTCLRRMALGSPLSRGATR
jgi:hypothetical protein